MKMHKGYKIAQKRKDLTSELSERVIMSERNRIATRTAGMTAMFGKPPLDTSKLSEKFKVRLGVA